jgi:hypothetical protein
MASSAIADKIAWLTASGTNSCDPRSADSSSSADVIAAVVHKAFALRSVSAAASYRGSVHVLDGDDRPVSGCFYGDMHAYLQSLQWEGDVLTAALRLLLHQEDADGLQIVLGLGCRAVRECAARKRATFCAIINRVTVPQAAATYSALSAGVTSMPFRLSSFVRACNHLYVCPHASVKPNIALTHRLLVRLHLCALHWQLRQLSLYLL